MGSIRIKLEKTFLAITQVPSSGKKFLMVGAGRPGMLVERRRSFLLTELLLFTVAIAKYVMRLSEPRSSMYDVLVVDIQSVIQP